MLRSLSVSFLYFSYSVYGSHVQDIGLARMTLTTRAINLLMEVTVAGSKFHLGIINKNGVNY